jgi:hypothetical protein
MLEYVATDVAHSIYRRATDGCECDNPACAHPDAKCGGELKDWGVALPEGTSEHEHLAKGRAFCHVCFMRSDSYFRQEAWRRPT